jgi:hypothetical protein
LRHVQSVAIAPDCVVIVTLADSYREGSSLRGQRIEMKARPDPQGALDWTYTATLARELLPESCRK